MRQRTLKRVATRRVATRRVVAALALLGVMGALAAVPAQAAVGDYTCTDPSKVYYGNQRLFQRPAVVDADQVYARIPEYREILRRGLGEQDPQYHILMRRVTKRFSDAVKKMAVAKSHDLVAQVGAVSKNKAREAAADVPNRTEDVILALD